MEKVVQNTFKSWMIAIRPPTMLIPTIQVATGTGVAMVYSGSINWLIAFYAWIVAVCITIGTNLINDACDYKEGGDPVGRSGRLKVINAGLLTQNQVYAGGLIAFAIACMVPFGLQVDAWACFGLVLLSVVCGYCYTAGPYPISYLGLSEIFVFIFYGGVCVMVPFYAQTYFLNPAILLAAAQMGMLAILPNALNNFRDMHEDVLVNKRTLAVRFGRNFARWEIASLTMAPFLLNIGWLFLGYVEAMLMPLLLLPIALMFVRAVWHIEATKVLNKYFGLSVLIHFFFGVLLIIGLLIR